MAKNDARQGFIVGATLPFEPNEFGIEREAGTQPDQIGNRKIDWSAQRRLRGVRDQSDENQPDDAPRLAA